MPKTINRIEIKADCNCSKQQLIFELSFPLEMIHFDHISNSGYPYQKSHANSGILHAENADVIAMSAIGSNRITIKCKIANCFDSLDAFEKILISAP